jgi:hypothetical protein
VHLLRAHADFIGALAALGLPSLLNLAVLERILRFYRGALNCWDLVLWDWRLRGGRRPGLWA